MKADHRKVENLFTQYESAPDNEQKQKIAQQICTELTVHTLLEEEIFYPACRQQDVEEEMLDEAQVEHDATKILISELENGTPGSDMYDAKVKVLGEYVKHHVGEEEKRSDGIFANARKTGVDMKALGQRIATRKQELMAEAEADELEPQAPQSLHLEVLAQQGRNQEYNIMARQSNYRRRDEMGRFTDDDDDRGSRYSSRSRDYDEDDDRGRGGGRGWHGDSEGHSMAARSRSGSSSRYSSRRDEDDDDDRGSRDRGQGGWFGDPRGHSMASRRGWEERGSSRYEDDDDDRGSRSRSRSSSRYEDEDDDYRGRSSARSRGGSRYEEDDEDEGRGWHGDPRGHAEAARRGWETREREGTRSRSSSRYEDDDDDRRSSRGRGGSQGGWFGDPEGHSEASRRGWRNR
ncbi:hemerythrin domain-containing protein [Dongia soli]|uniref:Hemerythrin domain-containing protein n=1 Tax=Dongia soli TaxID=600628 RepID=A0ABU5EEM4_9PROT|nr:hemerythrin domain-containing protein [Dongia soli]MDY0884833.1 hemerythrin domain-containing protein [Dongia soli]